MTVNLQCKVPTVKGTNKSSQLFKDIRTNIADNNNNAVSIWGRSQLPSYMQKIGLSSFQDYDAVTYLNSIPERESILTPTEYSRYLQLKHKNDVQAETYTQASVKQDYYLKQYPNVIPIIKEENEKYRIQFLPKSDFNIHVLGEQKSLQDLNKNLIGYLENLGFSVEQTMQTESSFNPTNAKRTANNLIQAIQLAKGEQGQQDLPEEFSHLMVAGLKDNIITQRLLKAINEQVAEDVLGEQYEMYKKRYKGNFSKIQEEVAGRLVAQHLVDRSGINARINYISNKFLDKVKNNLQKGIKEEVLDMLQVANEQARIFVDNLMGNTNFISNFKTSNVLKSSTFYHVNANIKSLQNILKENYKTLAKRIKILSFKQSSGVTKEQYTQLQSLQRYYQANSYVTGNAQFASYVLEDAKQVFEDLQTIQRDFETKKNDKGFMRNVYKVLNGVEAFLEAYRGPLKVLATISLTETIETTTPEHIERLETVAKECLDILDNIENIYEQTKLSSLLEFYKKYWGKDKLIKAADGTDQTLTLESVLQSCVGDTSVFNRMINGMADSHDPLLQLVDTAYKDATSERDAKIQKMIQKIAGLQGKYRESSGTNDVSFMYEKNIEGKLTGMFISDIDFARFYKEKHDYYESIKNDEPAVITKKLRVWKEERCEPVKLPNGRVEYMPKKALYPSNSLNSLTDAQKQYYEDFMKIYGELQLLIPSKNTQYYKAPQKRISSKEALFKGDIKNIFRDFKDKFVKISEDFEYGETFATNGKYVILDFAGKEVKRIPVYYQTWLENMEQLDTNASDVLLSYAGMAYNYQAMNSIADVLELTNSQMQSRDIHLTSGGQKMFTKFRMGETFTEDYTVKGANSELIKQLSTYIDSHVYGRKKETISKNKKKGLSLDKTLDMLNEYTTLIGMGFNTFSAVSNISMGMIQMFRETAGGENFKIKDLLNAHKNYFAMIGKGVAGQYENSPTDKLNLLINKFDVLGDFFQSLDSSAYNQGLFKKMIGKANPLIMNSMGEHYLRCTGMLAVLNNYKVMHDGKEVSIIDVLKVKDSNLVLEDNVTKLDGSNFTENDFFMLKQKIKETNKSMHGGFSDEDKGELHRYVLGRLLMKFRQWMPAFYMNRFKSERLNVNTGKLEEGSYITLFKFARGFISDAIHLKCNIAQQWGNLTDPQKANMKKNIFECSLLFIITQLLNGFALFRGDDDDDNFGKVNKQDPAMLNMLKYILYRVKMELGASVILAPRQFYENAKTLIKTPLPAMENLDLIIGIFDFASTGDIIERGKYKGWSVWQRNAYNAVPFARNIGKTVEFFQGETDIFNPYLK